MGPPNILKAFSPLRLPPWGEKFLRELNLQNLTAPPVKVEFLNSQINGLKKLWEPLP